MSRLLRAVHVALGCIFVGASPAAADAIRTDANIVTGIDISESISPEEIRLQVEGMAQAIRTQEVLQAIAGGRYGRIGFAVFAWHRDGQYPLVVSWTLIACAGDAGGVSDQLAGYRRPVEKAEARPQGGAHGARPSAVRLTDISRALEFGAEVLRAAPFATSRPVLNVISDGVDNWGEGPRRDRDTLVARGATINGVVLGGDPALIEYFRQQVVGGPGAFVLPVQNADAMQQFVRKLRADIVAQATPADVEPGNHRPEPLETVETAQLLARP